LEKSLSDFQVKFDALQPLLDKTKADLELVKTDLVKEKTDHQVTVKNLSLSEVDKVNLQKSVDEANKKIKKLETELQVKAGIADSYVRDLKEKCSKLSIQINGMNHNAEIFDKEMASLSVEDLKLKIEGLEKQLAQSLPPGRQTVTKTMIIEEHLNEGSKDNPALYKFKKN
jgi:uncharacterized protein YjaG (DUF416 family)